jgi:anti-sigma factor RsiW
MNCQDSQHLLNGYLDRELDLVHCLEMESHLAGCPSCARAYQSQQTLRQSFEKGDLYFHAPASLATAVRSRLAMTRTPDKDKGHWGWSWRWAAAAGMVALTLAGIVWVSVASRRSERELLAQDAVSAHIRSLMANHLTDVTSTDQHTVKPWFAGKLDFSPPVIDLALEGFPLEGGRLDYFAGRPVAALVYSRRKHLINLFALPSEKHPASSSQPSAQRGFNFIHWAQGGMEWWAVSDLNADELAQFTQLIRAHLPAP